jgi:cold shock protein
MQTGTVKWFNSQKGFGFIQPDNGGPDVFVHISAVEKSGMGNLNEGQKLSFDVQNDPKNRKVSATNLQKAGAAAAKTQEPVAEQDDAEETSDQSDDDQDDSNGNS